MNINENLINEIFKKNDFQLNDYQLRTVKNNLQIALPLMFSENDLMILDKKNDNKSCRNVANDFALSHEKIRLTFYHMLERLQRPQIIEILLTENYFVKTDKINYPIEFLKLDNKTYNLLIKNNIFDIETIVKKYNVALLCQLKSFGVSSVNKLIFSLNNLNIKHNFKTLEVGKFQTAGNKSPEVAIKRLMKRYNLNKDELIKYVENIQEQY